MKTKLVQYSTALYLRLSKDDDGVSESASITTQKKMLILYAKENSFPVYDIYIDDGYSGTNFNRPAFRRMMKDIKEKKVNLVITKDLSRLGRDYITTGQYTEVFFPENGVRYIAVNDGYDSKSLNNDIAPFKNVVNEMYARDISKKIRSSLTTKMEEGCFIGNFAPYGYKKDPENKNHLIIDEEAARVVRKIFDLAKEGNKPKQIAGYLNASNIMTPAMYRCSLRTYLNVDNYSKRKEWTSSTVSKILHNDVYLGHMAQGKTNKISFKSDKTVANKREDWIIVKNTHEPIISQKTYDSVRWQVSSRQNNRIGSFQNIFSGLAKCMDCGRNMSSTGTRKQGKVANLVCGGYKLYGHKECSNHFIDYETLYEIVQNELKKQFCLSEKDKCDIFQEVKNNLNETRDNLALQQQKKLSSLMSRNKELDSIIQRIYEDNLSGKISDDRFIKLSQTYEKEQHKVEEEITNISGIEDTIGHKDMDYLKFLNLLEQYTNSTELTRKILNELIDHIEIGQGFYVETDVGKMKMGEIRIYFKFSKNEKLESIE